MYVVTTLICVGSLAFMGSSALLYLYSFDIIARVSKILLLTSSREKRFARDESQSCNLIAWPVLKTTVEFLK